IHDQWEEKGAGGTRSERVGGRVSKRTWSHTLAREDPHHTYRRGIRLSRTADPEIRRHVLGPTRQEKRESLPGESSGHYEDQQAGHRWAPDITPQPDEPRLGPIAPA